VRSELLTGHQPAPLGQPLRPVVSVGNIALGGRGKSPTVRHIADLLLAAGQHPAILSRGYGRRCVEDGVTIVSDRQHIRADLDRSGDEPLMLARALRGACVLVAEIRAQAAALAESHLGATVHVLDDGFQHRSIRRDVDLVLVSPADFDDRRLPFGRLRSPVDALRRASAVILDGSAGTLDERRLDQVLAGASVPRFSLRRELTAPVALDGRQVGIDTSEDVVAFAGIAQPDRFRQALERTGWRVGDFVPFPDHHRYTPADLRRIAGIARGRIAFTTDKDATRLLSMRPLPMPVLMVPLIVSVEPHATFAHWLSQQLEARLS
jgi:tetraacyldisaccharide 4'-kinase